MLKKIITLFKLGRKIAKSDILDIESRKEIEKLFSEEMKEIGYL